MQELRGSEKIVDWVRNRLTNVNCLFQAAVVHRISRSYWKLTSFHWKNAGAWNVLKMIALITGIQVGMNIVWHWKVRAAQNFYSGEFNFALTIAFQSYGGDVWKKNRGDEDSTPPSANSFINQFMADLRRVIEETAQELTSKWWEERQKLLEMRKQTNL